MMLRLLIIASLVSLFIVFGAYFARHRKQKRDPGLEAINHLLHSTTPEGAALREHGLRRLEELLLAKTDWPSPEAREKTLSEFYSLAARLREVDAKLRKQREP
jgi:hypothetical protein